jgi:hypothetical protein
MVSRVSRMTKIAVVYLTVVYNMAVPDRDVPLGIILVESSVALVPPILMVILLNAWISSIRTNFFQQI